MDSTLFIAAFRIADASLTALHLAPYVSLCLYLGWRLAQLGDNRKDLLGPACVSLAGCVIFAFAIHCNPLSDLWKGEDATLHDPNRPFVSGLFYYGDDAEYDLQARSIASRWREGERPKLRNDYELGTLHTGYYRFLAVAYFVFGPIPVAMIGVNLLACVVLAAAAYFLAESFADRSIAILAAWLSALYSSFWFHSSFLMRDAWITLFFTAILACWFQLKRDRELKPSQRIALWAGLLFMSGGLFLLRYYLVVVLAAGLVLFEIALGSRRRQAWMAIVAFAAAALIARIAKPVADLQNQMITSMLWAIPVYLDNLGAVASRFAAAGAKLFLAPLPWASTGVYAIEYFLWPGQWMIYLLLLPFGIWGIVQTARQGPAEAIILFLPFVLGLYGYAVVLEGAVPRQRMFLDALLILFAAKALVARREGKGPSRYFLIGYYALLSIGVATHIASLFARGLWRI